MGPNRVHTDWLHSRPTPTLRLRKSEHTVRTRLRAALEYRGMTTTDLQWRARIDKKTLSRWADGIHEPKLSSIAALCRALDISADWLCGLTDEIEPGVLYPEPVPVDGAVRALDLLDAPPSADGNSGSAPAPTRSRGRQRKPPSA